MEINNENDAHTKAFKIKFNSFYIFRLKQKQKSPKNRYTLHRIKSTDIIQFLFGVAVLVVGWSDESDCYENLIKLSELVCMCKFLLQSFFFFLHSYMMNLNAFVLLIECK